MLKCAAFLDELDAATTRPANRTAPSRQMMVDLASLPSSELYW
jgi:hypothetical protein